MNTVVCPYCKAELKNGLTVVCCIDCQTAHHYVCWREHGDRCSVFSCAGHSIAIPTLRRNFDLLIFLWCGLNYALHLGLRLIGTATDSLSIPDVLIVVSLETLILLAGAWFVRSRCVSNSSRTMGLLLFSGNSLFLIYVLSHWAIQGFTSVNALIRL
jgi:hypothetical protein